MMIVHVHHWHLRLVCTTVVRWNETSETPQWRRGDFFFSYYLNFHGFQHDPHQGDTTNSLVLGLRLVIIKDTNCCGVTTRMDGDKSLTHSSMLSENVLRFQVTK